MRRDVGAVVPAAGKGERFGSLQPKLFVRAGGAPLILHTLRALEQASVGWIVVASRPEYHARLHRLIRQHKLGKVCAVVAGGASRADSVARGVAALPQAARWVLIHDGARPCVSPSLIERIIHRAKQSGGAVCGLPASVTVKSVDAADAVRLTLDRDGLWFVQTPQVFRREWFVEALARADGRLDCLPDDAALLEWAGFPVQMMLGDPLNIKVTTREDLMLAEAILKSRSSGKVTRWRSG